MSRQQQQQQLQQQQQQEQRTTHIDLDDFIFDEAETAQEIASPHLQGQPHRNDGNVSNKDPMSNTLLPSSSLGMATTRVATRGGGERAFAASIADNIPILSAVAVS
jgi:hypothetical protein